MRLGVQACLYGAVILAGVGMTAKMRDGRDARAEAVTAAVGVRSDYDLAATDQHLLAGACLHGGRVECRVHFQTSPAAERSSMQGRQRCGTLMEP